MDQGHKGFLRYLSHTSRFRPAAVEYNDAKGGLPTLRVCDVSNPFGPSEILQASELRLQVHLRDILEGSLLQLARPVNGHPRLLREYVALLLQKGSTLLARVDDVFVAPGSSVQWLEVIISELTANHYNREHSVASRRHRPIFLAPRGSFKCGGYFPHAAGAELRYIPTRESDVYKVDANALSQSILEIEESGVAKVVGFILETPSALGQHFTREELEAISDVVMKHPDMMLIQDCYNRGTEHDGRQAVLFPEVANFACRSAIIVSYRRDWGQASVFSNFSAAYTRDEPIRKALEERGGHSVFHCTPQFTCLGLLAAESIAKDMLTSDFPARTALEFAKHYTEVANLCAAANRQLAGVFSCSTPLQLLHIHSGQFGFLILHNEVAMRGEVQTSSKLAEAMCIYPTCRVMPTLLEPMGLIDGPAGFRFNMCPTNDLPLNIISMAEMFQRVVAFLRAIAAEGAVHRELEPVIRSLYALTEPQHTAQGMIQP